MVARHYCYVHADIDKPDICKFGEHHIDNSISSLSDSDVASIKKRIRDSLSVNKYLFDDGKVTLRRCWDVTTYATSLNKNVAHSGVDNHIRSLIGHIRQSEVHDLSADEMIIKVNEILSKQGQPLPEAGLTQSQHSAAENVIAACKAGKKTVLAELCPRFGKTIWGGVIVREMNFKLAIVFSYVLTSMTSFKKEFTSFEQFKDFLIVDMKEEGYEEKIKEGLKQGKQVIALMSLYDGSKRQSRVNFLFGLPCPRLVVIDEADYGAHMPNQVELIKMARKSDDVVILMTGTNGDRAVSTWNVDHYLSVTYPELIIEKRLTQKA